MKKGLFIFLLFLSNITLADNPCGLSCTQSLATQTISNRTGAKGATGDAGTPGAAGTSADGCTGSGGECLVFVTIATMNGDLNTGLSTALQNLCVGTTDIDRANCICRHEGANYSKGKWRAWLSTSTVDAVDNIDYSATKVYVRAYETGTNVANAGVLTGGGLTTSVAGGGLGFNALVWTGTDTDGTANADTCSDWTDATAGSNGQRGSSATNFAQWTSLGSIDCTNAHSLYCFESP